MEISEVERMGTMGDQEGKRKGPKEEEKKGKDSLEKRNLRKWGGKNHPGFLRIGRRLRKPQR